MSWMEDIGKALRYIEENLSEDITIDDVARHVNLSPFYFQKGFALLCNYSVSEYIRNRRLTLAGKELATTNAKVIDVALKYGYDSPDSFTKAFTRFHGVTPVACKNGEGEIKMFSPLHMQFQLKGGFEMNVKIVKKPAFKVAGFSKMIDIENGYQECPKAWVEHFQMGRGKYVGGVYGICIDENVPTGKFVYMIADDYANDKEYPEDIEIIEIPEFTWAVFTCIGEMPNALQEVNTKIFQEWLPGNGEYDIAAGYGVEFYDDQRKYPLGTQDKNYYSEIWIPVKSR